MIALFLRKVIKNNKCYCYSGFVRFKNGNILKSDVITNIYKSFCTEYDVTLQYVVTSGSNKYKNAHNLLQSILTMLYLSCTF